MTSPYATDAVVKDMEYPRFARVDADGYPIQGQLPQTIAVVTASGAIPTQCPSLIVISGAAPITLTATSLVNLVGREVTFSGDGVNAVAHVVTLPAGSIGGPLRTATFAANASSSVTYKFFQNGGSFYAAVVSSRNITFS